MSSRLALVTGGSGGIGLELARLFAQAGYDLALVARTQSKLDEAAAALGSKFGISVKTIALDLSQPGAADVVYAQVPTCEVLVNNAGFANNGTFAQMQERVLMEELQVDVVALTQLTRRYLPGMLERGEGKILNLASTAAFLPGPNMAVYYAAKAYVLSFSEALAEEVRGKGVGVTCLCPGATATGFQERANLEGTPLMRLPLADAAKVAKAGFDGLMRGKTVVVPGLSNKLVAVAPRISPRRLLLAISAKSVKRA